MRLELREIEKNYGSGAGKTAALQDISLTFCTGDRIILKGESGAGKSTLLRLIGLIDGEFSGEYFINGRSTRDFKAGQLQKMRNQTFGFIFQEYALIEDDTVFENVKVPLLYSNIKRKDYKKEIERVLEMLGLLEFIEKKVKNLSGGQRQRVAIARALVNRPEIIIADEPTASLDSHTKKQVLQVLNDYLDETKILIMATHDLAEVDFENKIEIELVKGHVVA